MDSSRKIVRDGAVSIDKQIKSSMPDTWAGHGRLAIRESDVIPMNAEDTAIEQMNQIAETTDARPEKAANALISKIAEKMDD